MNAPCKDITRFIHSDLESVNGVNFVEETNLFYGRMPDQPATCIAVFDNPGDPPLLTLKKETSAYFYSSVNVRVRSISYDAAYAIMTKIVELLHGMHGVDVAESSTSDSGTFYCLIRAQNDPQVLYWDKNDRVIFFTHFDIQRKPN